MDIITLNTVLNVITLVLIIFLSILTVYKMTLNNNRNKEYLKTICQLEEFVKQQAEQHNREFHDLGETLNRYLDYIARNASDIRKVDSKIESSIEVIPK